jgi:uncharacterized protein (UPF0332 family)
MTPFARALVRKSERALKTARIALSSGDFDNAVNRSFYSMFDIARAALLEAGVAEDKLPRTHSGLIDAFRQHAVQTGKFDRDMAADMSRIESHRIRADYTGFEIEPNVAAEAVAKAVAFVQTAESVFNLGDASQDAKYQTHTRSNDDKVSETVGDSKIEKRDAQIEPVSLEEIRRQARENWLRLRQQKVEGVKGKGADLGHDTDREARNDQSHSIDDDLNE